MDVKLRNKQVKKVLSNAYGHKNVSVRNGQGTAWGWCDISIKTTKSDKCSCNGFYCQACKDKMNATSQEAEQLLQGIEFYNYTDDMGSRNTELIIQVSAS